MYGMDAGMGGLKKIAAKKAEKKKKKMSKTMKAAMEWDKAESTPGFKPTPAITKAKKKGKK